MPTRRDAAVRAPRRWLTLVAAAAALLAMGPLLVGSAPAVGGSEPLAGPVPAGVVAVIDGDTLVVRASIWLGQQVETRVRLAGIDAPELRGSCARERELAAAARGFLEARLAKRGRGGARVQLSDVRYGKYAGRVVARVTTVGGADLGRALLAAGLARPYGGGERSGWCEQAD